MDFGSDKGVCIKQITGGEIIELLFVNKTLNYIYMINYLSDDIRKSYILQYAPEGSKRVISQSLTEDLNDENRQFLILQDGKEIN